MGNVVTQTALITPTSGTSTGALADYEMAKFRENNGTVSVGVDIVTGDIVASLGTINSGTITRLEQGSINVTKGTVSAGTINAGTVNAGTINVATVTAGTINTGTINAGTINLGTVVGAGGTGVVAVGNPLVVAGTDGGGSVYAMLVDTSGNPQVDIAGGSVAVTAGTIGTVTGVGTLTNVGSITNIGTVLGVGGTVSVDLVTGDIVASLGTIQSGTITRVEGGSIAVTAGTTVVTGGSIAVTAGTFTGAGGSIIAYGAGGTGVAAVGNPQVIAGTDSGGTTYGLKVNTSGNQQVDIQTGTITSITNLAGGTIGILTNGTLSNSGTTTGVGSVSNIGSMAMLTAGTVSMINAGTITSVGTVPGVGVVTSLSGGTITKLEGGTLGILSQGSINVTAGTVIVTNGTVGAGTINLGSVGGLAGSAAPVSGNPLYVGGQGANGTLYPLLTDTTGKPIVVMSVGTIGAGTVAVSAGTVIQTVGTVNTGTVNVATITAGTLTNLISGTINSATVTGNLGTLSMLSAGTVTNVGSVVGLGGTVVGTSIGFPLISGEDQTNDVLKVENQMNGTYLQAAGTTTLKGTAAGLLHTINIGLPAVSDVITAYDSQVGTSGTIIAKITLPGTLLSQAPMFGLYDIKFTNGLAISQTGTSNISISWR